MNKLKQNRIRSAASGFISTFVPLGNLNLGFIWSVPLIALLGFASSLLEGIGIGLLIPLLGAMLGSSQLGGQQTISLFMEHWLSQYEVDSRIRIIMFTMLVLIFFKGVLQIANYTFISWMDGKIGVWLRAEMVKQALRVEYPFYFAHNPSRLVNVIDHETWNATQALKMLSSMAASGAAVVVFTLLLLVIDWRLLLLVLFGIVLVRKAMSFFNRRLERLSEEFTVSHRLLTEKIMSLVYNARLIRIFGQEKYEMQRFETASEEFRSRVFEIDRRVVANGPLAEILYAALFLLVMLLAVFSGNSIPSTLAFLIILYRMQPQLLTFIQARANFTSFQGAVREVEWFLGEEGKPTNPGGLLPNPNGVGSVIFSNVDFSYPSGNEKSAALSSISFEIPDGSVTALIGRSGSGKTTIVNLLCRLLEPVSGTITANDTNIADFDLASWRGRIAIAGQDIELFDGTIAENIAYGLAGATAVDIVQAARLADADDFIEKLPAGYESVVGSRGINLSGGERQRIGLARALVRKPDLLILDEATNAVDGLSEKTIFGLLHDRMQFRTALVISHQQSTLENCDHGIVLDNGRIVETGPLRDLNYYQGMEAGK